MTDKKLKKKSKHPIFLYDFLDDSCRLTQVVNVYKHTFADFYTNSLKIVKHIDDNLGGSSVKLFTVGQSIRYRVYKGQEPIDESLFKFLLDYSLLIVPILGHADMHDWRPKFNTQFSTSYYDKVADEYIKMTRSKVSSKKIDEYLEIAKYVMNHYCEENGKYYGLAISNSEFVEVTNRSPEARRIMNCEDPIPKDITPDELERINSAKTTHLLNIIGEQKDLSISTYANSNLFNPAQFREFGVHMGYKPDLHGNTIPFTCNTNIIKGLKDPKSYVVDAAGGRKAEILKLNVSDAGALERSWCMLLSDVSKVDIDYECDSKHFRHRKIDSADTLEKLEGRVCTFDPDSDEYLIIDTNNRELIGKTVYLKTPITCTHPDRDKGVICSACYGKMMANLNNDIHIGRLAAINCADDMEQKLLSAKHALATNTSAVEFTDNFNLYFEMAACRITFNQDTLDMSVDDPEEFSHLYLEFYLGSIKKNQDGEGRPFDRQISEITVYNDKDDTRTNIIEQNGTSIFFSPEFNEYFLDASKHVDAKGIVQIPFTDLIDTGKRVCEVLFEYQYKNNELASPLLTLESILTSGAAIGAFKNYDECLDTIIPLFIKGGIHLPEFQFELLISKMIYTPDRKRVDWTLDDPEYQFFSIDKSIQNSPSPTTSILYHESSRQIAGAYNLYSKKAPSAYDNFLANT